MTQSKARFAIIAITGIVLAAGQAFAQEPEAAQDQSKDNSAPVAANAGQGGYEMPMASNLFHNYYTTPGAGATAAMYPSPRPIPYNTGLTYYTYQPLRPHEHLYQHNRTYYNYYGAPGGFYSNPYGCGAGGCGAQGVNKTTVIWQAGCNHFGPLPSSLNFMNRLHYRWEPGCRGYGTCR